MNISSNNYNNSIMSLDEENDIYQRDIDNKREIRNENSNSGTFFSKIINSVSKIGQGLKNIMSMRINLEEDNNDNFNPNTYEQISNRFHTNEEISLIDAPSFIEDSYTLKKYPKTFELDNDNSKMMISHNETKRDDYEINSFNKDIENKEEIINTDIFQPIDKKVEIKSNLLNKKRERGFIPEKNIYEEEKNNIEKEEEEQNEEIEDLKKNVIYKPQNKLKDKSFYSSGNNKQNKSMKSFKESKNKNNSYAMNLSMKSLDNIKDEINQRREENLRNIEEMHKRHGLYYDYLKEAQMREKILDEYYKEKAKRIAEERNEMEKKRRKRLEEFQKLKIKKETGLKFASLPKKPKIFKETKSSQIQFSGKPINLKQNENDSNNLNITFGNNSNNSNNEPDNKKIEKKIENKDNNYSEQKPSTSLFGNLDNNVKINEDKKNENEKPKTIIDNKKTSIFSDLMGDKNINNENPKEKSLFSGIPGNSGPIFGAPSMNTGTQSPFSQSFINNNNNNSENKKEEKKDLNKANDQKNEPKGLFTAVHVGNSSEQKGLFSGNSNNENSQSIFFSNDDNKNNLKDNKIFGTNSLEKKEGLFNQHSAVSQTINNTSLFTSNINGNNEKSGASLLNKTTNPFLQNSQNTHNTAPSLFGNNQQNDNNNQNKPTQSLFGNQNQPNKSLFGNISGGTGFNFGTKGLFG